MTVMLSGTDAASQIKTHFPDALAEDNAQAVVIKSDFLLDVTDFLKHSPDLTFNFLADLTAVDFLDYFEIVYRLTSLEHNHSIILKVRCYDRQDPAVPSLTGLYRGANFFEREIYDLMGIRFTGHPNLTRIFLWEGFAGHPLRKDYIG